MPRRKPPLLALVLITAVGLTSCSADAAPIPTELTDDHGAVAGAEEVAEPALHLLTLGTNGSIDQLDLIDERWDAIGHVDGVTETVSDGRFLFATDATSGVVTIVDSGMWTRDHEDHFHYYRGSPRVVGSVDGSGKATISPGSSATGLFFPESGESVLIDNEALGEGSVVETLRLAGQPHAGSLVQLGSHTLRTTSGGSERASGVQVLDADGADATGTDASCDGSGAPITTAVGVAYPCTDGALLATNADDGIRFEHIPYPTSAVPPAESFAGREGRPTVAGLAGDEGIWVLDTRERTLTLLPKDAPLLQITAVDDEPGHLLGLTVDGRVTVLTADGETLATTEVLLGTTIADPAMLQSVRLVVDQQRAWLNAPAERLLYEIDFADSARIARTFATDNEPRFFAGTGR